MLKINNFTMTNSSTLFQSSPLSPFSIFFQHYRDCQERKQKYNQNLVQIMTVISITLSCISYIFLNKLLSNPTLAKIFSLAFTGLILVAISRFIPQLLSVLVVLLTISAPLIVSEFQNNIFVSFILTSMGPLFTLLMTSSHKCFMISTFIYLIDFNKKFKEDLIAKLANIEDHNNDFLEKAFATVSIQIILSMLVYAAMDYTSQRCMTEIIQKEESLEKVKSDSYRLFEEIYTQISDPLKNLYATIDFYVAQHTLNQVLSSLKSVQTSIKLFRNELENVITHEKMKSQDLETQPMASRTYDWLSEIWVVTSDLLKERGPVGFMKIQRKVPPLLYLDSVKIQQILLNLLQYAIEKTKKGVVNLTVEWLDTEAVTDKSFEPLPYNYEEEGIFEKKEALHFLDKSNTEKNQDKYQVFRTFDKEAVFESCNYSQKISFGTLKCTIWNTSPGLSEKQVSKIFDEDNEENLSADPQIKQINTRPLKISREICRKMDGEIRAYSKENVGMTFIACFPIPVYNSPEMPVDIRNKIIKLRKKNLSVMLGHNDLTFSFQINNYLKSLEATVEDEAGKGSEFFTKLIDLAEIRKQVDLVIVDLSMSHIDVAMFCERLRNHEKKNQLGKLYVILTGNTEKEGVINNLLNKNHPGYVNKYLRRPFEFYDFLEALADIS